jgi:RNA polymerase sigma-70 factor (ECF subfamily)
MRRLSTEQLFLRFRRGGDTEALGEVFDRTAPELFKLALFLAPAASDAEDLLQETFLTAIRCADGYDAARPLRPWLLGILGNHARRARRRKRPVPDVLPRRVLEDADPSIAAENAEIGSALRAAIDALALPYRQVVALHLLHGLQAREIADVLERPAGTVRSQIVRGLERLRRALPAGLALAAAALLTPGHALAGVRSEVLRAAQRLPTAPPLVATALPARAVFGGLSMLLAVGALGWFWVARGDTPTSAPPPATVGAARAEAERPRSAERDASLAPAVRAPLAAAARGGRIELRLVFADGGAADGVGVQLLPWPDNAEPVHIVQLDPARRVAHAGEDGRLIFDDLAAGRFVAQVLGGRQRATVELDGRRHVRRELVLAHRHAVSGRAVDRDGRALAGCDIRLSPSAGRYDVGDLVASSDGEGRFALVSTEPLAFAWGSARGQRASRIVPISAATTDIELVLGEPGVELRGRVVDPRGAPLRGAAVAVVHSADMELATGYARTGDDGGFALGDLAPGEVAVVARRAGFGSVARIVDLDGAREVTLQLTEPATLRGRVLAADGRPLAFHSLFAEVSPQSWALSDAFLRSLCTATDASGAYVLDDLPAAPVRVRVVSADGQSWIAERHFDFQPAEQAVWDAQESGLPEIRGRVRDRAGAPVANAIVVATPLTGGDERVRRYRRKLGVTGADGGFVLQRAERDVRYRLTVHAESAGEPDEFSALGAVDAVRAGTRGVEIAAEPRPATAAIRGRLLEPSGGALVARRLPGSAMRAVAVDAEGGFVLDGLLPGSYRLGVGRADRGWEWLPEIVLHDGTRRDVGTIVPAARASLVVEVRDAAGAPVFAAELRLAGVDRALRTDAAGRCEIDDLVPGEYALGVSGAACVPQQRTIELAPAARRTVRIDAQRGSPCRLRFPFEPLDNTYDGAGLLHVAVSDARDRIVLEQCTDRLEDSAFVFEAALAPGHYRIEATSVWGARAAAQLAVAPGAEPSALLVPLRVR